MMMTGKKDATARTIMVKDLWRFSEPAVGAVTGNESKDTLRETISDIFDSFARCSLPATYIKARYTVVMETAIINEIAKCY